MPDQFQNAMTTCKQRDSDMTINNPANGGTCVEIKSLRKNFGELEVLKGIDLAARTGEVVSILGASGSGKSTLLRCVNFLENPTSGSITVSGETYKIRPQDKGALSRQQRHSIQKIRTKTAMVFQSFNLWTHRTVLQNVIEVPVYVQKRNKAQATEEAMLWLDRVGLSDKCDEYPAYLSGGQQQRAGIARALALNPEVLLFDEPTSALDPELVGEVLDVMRGLADEGRTMLVVTHEMNFARDVSAKVIFLHDGQVEEESTPEKIFSNPESEKFARFIKRMQNG